MNGWIQHSPRRLWYAPWRVVCRCHMGDYPCAAMRMREAQARYIDAVVAAQEWSADERRTSGWAR